MRFLSAKDLTGLLPPHALIAAVEQGLLDLADGRVLAPTRQHTHVGDLTLLSMPVIGQNTFGAKVVSVIPSNAGRGLPMIQGLMTLFDRTTGIPLAVMDAAALTAQRTGAVGAAGLKCISPAEIDSVGVIGVGVQGVAQAIFACAARPLRTIYFLARNDDRAKHFMEAVSGQVPSVRLVRCADAEELLSRTEVVITATNSATPVLPDDPKRLKGKHFISVGSYKANMQELPDSVYRLAREVFVDSDSAREEVGDLAGPLALGLIEPGDVRHLAECVAGRRLVDTAGTTVFKSVGMALYDLYAAQAFFAAAQRLNRGTMFDL